MVFVCLFLCREQPEAHPTVAQNLKRPQGTTVGHSLKSHPKEVRAASISTFRMKRQNHQFENDR